MSEDLRRRRPSEGSKMTLNLDTKFKVHEGGPVFGTPSPSGVKFARDCGGEGSSGFGSPVAEFLKKQQSFELQIEDCDEEELCADSDDEGVDPCANRGPTPLPPNDFAANITYKEGPLENFLQVKQPETDCVTDISDAESDTNDG